MQNRAQLRRKVPVRRKPKVAAPDLNKENADLKREVERLEQQQAATADVLNVISRSAGDLPAVFETILANATRICSAKFGTLYLSEDGGFRAVAMHNAPTAYAEERMRGLVRPGPNSSFARAAQTKLPAQVDDVTALPEFRDGHPFACKRRPTWRVSHGVDSPDAQQRRRLGRRD